MAEGDAVPVASEALREKVRSLPIESGVYLMKDAAGRVLYVGKAKNLRHRVSHYFTRPAAEDPRTADLVRLIADVDVLVTASEVDALLLEARLIKDIQPRFNVDLKDDKSFPYLQIRVREAYPRVEFTRSPRLRGVKLYGPFTSARGLRGAIQVLQRIFRFRTCSLDIDPADSRWRWYRPCILYSIGQCTAPCNLQIAPEQYRQQIRRLQLFLEGHKDQLIAELEREMKEASATWQFEKAAQVRDDIRALQALSLRGEADKDVQPEVFVMNPRQGVAGLKQVLRLHEPPRIIEGIDIAHLAGAETVAALVTFIDGMPFKPGYRRFRLRSLEGVDDYAAIREVVIRRYRRLIAREELFPDVVLIDGGRGQLHAALEAFALLGRQPACVLALAKQEEQIYRPESPEPLRLSRTSAALRLLQYVRDEAHRFAQHYHHMRREKRLREDIQDAGGTG